LNKRLNYRSEDYKKLLNGKIKDAFLKMGRILRLSHIGKRSFGQTTASFQHYFNQGSIIPNKRYPVLVGSSNSGGISGKTYIFILTFTVNKIS